MTIHEAKLLLAFNAWATQKIFDAVATLPGDQFTRDLKASHGSIQGTLRHLVTSEARWQSRFTPDPAGVPAISADPSTVPELKSLWEKTGLATARWLGPLTDRQLQDPFTATAADGTNHTHTPAQAIQHLVDHGTYHRGQIVTLLRQLGVTPPSTGMFRFFRETAKHA